MCRARCQEGREATSRNVEEGLDEDDTDRQDKEADKQQQGRTVGRWGDGHWTGGVGWFEMAGRRGGGEETRGDARDENRRRQDDGLAMERDSIQRWRESTAMKVGNV